MSKKRKPKNFGKRPRDENDFGLDAPTERASKLSKNKNEDASGDDLSAKEVSKHSMSKLDEAEAKFKAMGWKGIDEEEEEILDDDFGVKKEPIPEDELDMTPMVDVTFLLLIFFMVTASFTVISSIQQPHAQTDAPSDLVKEEEEIVDDFVQINIDQNNTYYVTSKDAEEVEAPSNREMRTLVNNAKQSTNATRMVIKAHVESMHRKVVTAWDAGIAAGINKIEIQTTDVDF